MTRVTVVQSTHKDDHPKLIKKFLELVEIDKMNDQIFTKYSCHGQDFYDMALSR